MTALFATDVNVHELRFACASCTPVSSCGAVSAAACICQEGLYESVLHHGEHSAEDPEHCRYQLPVVIIVLNNNGIYGGDRRQAALREAAAAGASAGGFAKDPVPTAFVPDARCCSTSPGLPPALLQGHPVLSSRT